MFLNNIWYPERYHGHHKRKNYFEGWYYKLVDIDLHIFKTPEELAGFRYSPADLPDKWQNWAEDRFALGVVNGEPLKLRYRGYQVRGIIRPDEGMFNLWLLTKKYFYRDHILFYLFFPDGELAARGRLLLNGAGLIRKRLIPIRRT